MHANITTTILRKSILILTTALLYLFVAGCTDANSMITPITLPDGSVYTGEMRNGRFHGQGELNGGNGDHYKGGFENGLIHGEGRWEFSNGTYYEGEFYQGMMQGKGLIVYSNGVRYEGEFKQDEFDGQGTQILRSGDTYTGHFKKGVMEGQGTYQQKDGGQYTGEFHNDELSGEGSYTNSEGGKYTGGFKNWKLHGKGEYVTAEGDIYQGSFVDGMMTGEGIHKEANGDQYAGNFKDWAYHGQGELKLKSGDRYQGEFQQGFRHGQGTLYLAHPKDGKRQLSGEWEYDQFVPAKQERRKRSQENVEAVLYNQEKLLVEQYENILPNRIGLIDLYFMGVGGYGKQDVFLKEVNTVRGIFDERFGTTNRSLLLVNNDNSASTYPLATITSIQRSLKLLATKMNADEDILFLYLTSHGGKKHNLSLSLNGLTLANIDATQLADILNEVDIKWRIVMVSACYSGGFIEPLKNDHTLVITAAAKDKRSYGCSDENEITDFARAYFLEALPNANSFEAAYTIANEIVVKEEKTRKVESPSQPQLWMGKLIADQLKAWRNQRNG